MSNFVEFFVNLRILGQVEFLTEFDRFHFVVAAACEWRCFFFYFSFVDVRGSGRSGEFDGILTNVLFSLRLLSHARTQVR